MGVKQTAKPDGLTRARRLDLYAAMVRTRATEDKLSALYRQGKITGGLYSSRGQEAISAGTTYALEKGDVVAPMIRNLGTLYLKGCTAREIFCQYLAKANGACRGKDNVAHFGDPLGKGLVAPISPLGTLIPVMAGVALALKKLGRRNVAMTYIGDGGASVGDFHEGLNLAAVLDLPFVLIIENNQWAYSTPAAKQFRCASLADRAPGYGIPGAREDGNDVAAVYRAARKAVEAARGGGGPQLLELATMRMRGHAEHDPAEYVPKELFEEWERRDPIRRAERHVDERDRRRIEEEIRKEIDDAAEFALKSPAPDPKTVLNDVFADDSIVRFTPWWERP